MGFCTTGPSVHRLYVVRGTLGAQLLTSGNLQSPRDSLTQRVTWPSERLREHQVSRFSRVRFLLSAKGTGS